MKKLLTVAVCPNLTVQAEAPNDETEISFAKSENEKALFELFRQAKGKYTVIADREFTFGDCENFLKTLDKENADIVAFDGGYAVKTSILKNLPVKSCADRFSAEAFGAFCAKTVAKTNLKPLDFADARAEYSQAEEEILTAVLDEFKISKSKLNKSVYSFIFEALLARLTAFYIGALLAIRRKAAEAEALKQFDLKLKENIVIYLALEKRFPVADLKKLREKDFKISFLQAKKFEKYI